MKRFMKPSILLKNLLMCFIISALVLAPISQLNVRAAETGPQEPFDRQWVPEPIFDEEQGFVDLYWTAWEQAWQHVHFDPDAPTPKFMDEAFQNGKIWIWDTCFMSMFCKYAPDQFPGVESLDNFYKIIHDQVSSSQVVVHKKNPPLFAWVEWQNYKFTNDKDRLHYLLEENQYLQKHFEYMGGGNPTYGYKWLRSDTSGMDNSTRFYKNTDIYAIDYIGQQALSAQCIAAMAQEINNTEIYEEYNGHYETLKELINTYYWDDQDGFYYDIKKGNQDILRVKTPASYWPVLANVQNQQQGIKMKEKATDDQWFAGLVPFPTLARNDSDFNPNGDYWRGGVWLPTTYMSIKSLEVAGYQEEADDLAYDMVQHQYNTFINYHPNTIWEAYSPTQAKPATKETWSSDQVRPDFCGWSALGPISLFIENVLGFHTVDAQENIVKWRRQRDTAHGIKRLTFGDIETSIYYANGVYSIVSNGGYTLEINGYQLDVTAGNKSYDENYNEVEFVELPESPQPNTKVNIALGKTASASSEESSSKAASKGNDNNLSTMWIAANGDNDNWWEVDLEEKYKLTDIELLFEDGESAWKYKVEVSNDHEAWSTVLDKTDNSSPTGGGAFEVDGNGRWVRITFSETPSGLWTAFREFKVYGELKGNIALNKEATAISYENTSRDPSKAVDGDLNTMWVAANGDENNWWQVDLGESKTMEQLKITFENDVNAWQYIVELSSDMEQWQQIIDATTNNTPAQSHVYDLNAEGRYVRVIFPTTPSGYWTAISEIEIK